MIDIKIDISRVERLLNKISFQEQSRISAKGISKGMAVAKEHAVKDFGIVYNQKPSDIKSKIKLVRPNPIQGLHNMVGLIKFNHRALSLARFKVATRTIIDSIGRRNTQDVFEVRRGKVKPAKKVFVRRSPSNNKPVAFKRVKARGVTGELQGVKGPSVAGFFSNHQRIRRIRDIAGARAANEISRLIKRMLRSG